MTQNLKSKQMPAESPLETARRIRDSLISSSQRFAEGGEVKKEESPMASPVGGAKQMLAELESQDKKIAERKRPRSKESIEEERASKELDRGTLMSGSLVAPTIAREGELTVRRFAGGGSADKGKLTLAPVGGVEFGLANPAPRSLKDYVPGAADLPRSPPQKAPGWGDAAAYNPQGLAYGFGTGVRNTLEGLAALPGTAADLLKGFAQREIRERSPEGMRGSAPAMDTTAYDAAKSALKEAAGNPVEAARNIRDSLVSYVRQGVATPQSTAQFIGENVNPLRPRGPVSRGPVLEATRPANYGVMFPETVSGKKASSLPQRFEEQGIRHLSDAYADQLPEGVQEEIEKFLVTKPRNYFARQMGTPNDPVFKNIMQGKYRISAVEKLFPDYALDQLKVGKSRKNPITGEEQFFPRYPQLRGDLAGAYDRNIGMSTYFLNPFRPDEEVVEGYAGLTTPGYARQGQLIDDLTERMQKQGVPLEEINTNATYGVMDREGKHNTAYQQEISDLYADLFSFDPLRKPSREVATAMERQEPLYRITPHSPLAPLFDAKSMVDYLSKLPPNKIRNLRFEDALEGAAKESMAKDKIRVVMEAIRSNRPVAREVFDTGTSAPLLSYGDDSPLKGFEWRQILDPEATQFEGAYLGHSVGGYSRRGSYTKEQKQDFATGQARIFSLRDSRGYPVTTVEVLNNKAGLPVATQIRGSGRATGNTAPTDEQQRAVVDLLRGPLKGALMKDRYIASLIAEDSPLRLYEAE